MPPCYRKVNHRFWTGDTGKEMRSMPMDVRAVASYLMTCASSNMIGLYYLPLMLLVHEVGSGLTLEGASKALRSLAGLGFAFYDDSSEVVFVPHMAREQIGESLSIGDKQRAGIIAQLKEYKKSRYYEQFVDLYFDCYHLEELRNEQGPSKALRRPFEGPSKPGSGTGAGTEERAPSKASPAVRPRSGHELITCLRVAVEKHQPENGMWSPGDSFAHKEAQSFVAGFEDIEAALSTIEARIELFAKDPDMRPWTVKKFASQYNAIGQPKRPQSSRQSGPEPFTWNRLPGT